MSETKPETPPKHDSGSATAQAPTVNPAPKTALPDQKNATETTAEPTEKKKEIGGRDGPDPTRFGDWEKAGRCIDF